MTPLSKLLLISLFILNLSSCGKNQVIGDSSDQAIFSSKLEAKFFTYTNDGQLRSNILNAFVEKNIKDNNSDIVLFSPDWLNSQAHELSSFTNDQIPNAKNYSRLFVSYADRTEVYFIPEKTNLNNIENSLGLDVESYRYFSWLIKDESAVAEKDYVLINLNHSDLMENDKKFYAEEIKINGVEDLIEVRNGSVLNVEIDYEILKQALYTVVVPGNERNCPRDFRESGRDCGCQVSLNIPSNNYTAISTNDTNLFGFYFRVNDKLVTLENILFNKIHENKISFDVDFSEHYLLTPTFKLTRQVVQVSEVSQGFAYNGNCYHNSSRAITRTIKSNLTVKYKLLGRGENLKNIKL